MGSTVSGCVNILINKEESELVTKIKMLKITSATYKNGNLSFAVISAIS
jgi:hypothetical protein